MVTILSDQTNQKVGEKLYASLRDRNIEAEFISIADMNVGPCYGCGGCTNKTYGRCVYRDDADILLPKLMESDVMVIVTPVKWGSYSFKTKRVFDKCALIGDRHYYEKNGELVKGKIGGIQTFLAVGVKENWSEVEAEVFDNLVDENIRIMNIKGRSYRVDNNNATECFQEIMEDLSK